MSSDKAKKTVKKIDAVATDGAKATVETVQEVPTDVAKVTHTADIPTTTDSPGVVAFTIDPAPPLEVAKVPKGKKLVNSDALDAVLKRMTALEAETKELKAENEALADKGRLAKLRAKNAPTMGKTVRLGTWEGQVILGWDSLSKNWCEKTPTGNWAEQIERTLHLADGTKKTMPYIESARHIGSIDANVIGEKTTNEVIDNDGNFQVLLDVVDEKGRPWTIDNRFIN